MGMYDSVWFKNKKRQDIDLQFKCGDGQCENYKIGNKIPLPDGIYFCYGGCFVVFKKKVVAAFDEKEPSLIDKWGGTIPYPELTR